MLQPPFEPDRNPEDDDQEKPPRRRRGRGHDAGEDELKPKEPDPILLSLIARISRDYSPARSFEEADLTLTTVQLLDQLRPMFPVELDGRLIFQALEQIGFRYDEPFGDLNYVWLLKRSQ